MKNLAIFTIKDDLHSLTIQKEIRDRGYQCYLIEVDRLWEHNKINIDFENSSFNILDKDNEIVEVEKLSTIWWRRSVRVQSYENSPIKEKYKNYINNEFEHALIGLLNSSFIGKWISNPFNTTMASNKIYQTKTAISCNLNYPKTLYSQNVETVYKFIKENEFDVIIKPIYGTTKMPIYTQKIDKSKLPINEEIEACPTIYQELITGTVHYRINVFGENIYAFRIITEELDWRLNMTNRTEFFEIDDELKRKILNVLSSLNIKMGIFDFKVSEKDGKPYFFEINPQGNFLFLQGLTQFNLVEKFADFLISD